MELVNPTVRYKESYLDLVKVAKENGDILEVEKLFKKMVEYWKKVFLIIKVIKG